jgi:hypothetical protein
MKTCARGGLGIFGGFSNPATVDGEAPHPARMQSTASYNIVYTLQAEVSIFLQGISLRAVVQYVITSPRLSGAANTPTNR